MVFDRKKKENAAKIDKVYKPGNMNSNSITSLLIVIVKCKFMMIHRFVLEFLSFQE